MLQVVSSAMGRNLFSIGKVCGARAGLTTLIFSDMTNVANHGPEFLPPAPNTPPSFTDLTKVYSIAFQRYTGVVNISSQNYQGGDYEVGQILAHVPRGRAAMDMLLGLMRNRLLIVIGIDKHGNQHTLYDARRSYKYTTGDQPGTRHGYNLEFNAPNHFLLPWITGDGNIETAPPIGDIGSPGGGGSEDCCITINPVNILYTPLPTGNVNNRNELVTTPDQTLYFIDGDGRSVIINRPPPLSFTHIFAEGFTGTEIPVPEWFELPDPNDYPGPVYDAVMEIDRQLFVQLGSDWLMYQDEEGFTIDIDNHVLPVGRSLDGMTVKVYRYRHYPKTPVS